MSVEIGEMHHFPRAEFIKVDGGYAKMLPVFEAPHEKAGYVKNYPVGELEGRELVLNAASGMKWTRTEMGSGDNLFITAVQLKRNGLFVLADVEDGFTLREDDIGARDALARGGIAHPDAYFSQLMYGFRTGDGFKDWVKITAQRLGQMPRTIDGMIPGHASFGVEGLLKYTIRDYLERKNDYRTQLLGADFQKTAAGVEEAVNGIWGVTAMWLPNEIGQVSDGSGIGISGVAGGYGVCRSLADTICYVTWPERKVFKKDANQYVDALFVLARTLMNPNAYQVLYRRMYQKINQVYAAFNHRGGIEFPLTEEDQGSKIWSKNEKVECGGSTDGGYFLDRAHNGDAEALFQAASDELKEDPAGFAGRRKNPGDDFVIFNMPLQ